MGGFLKGKKKKNIKLHYDETVGARQRMVQKIQDGIPACVQ
jgi:hypothetical protein